MRKSVLVAGSTVALVAVLAVAVPPLIDWTGTKERIANRLAEATGRPVRIDGRMTLRLLPSPALTADGVVIGNPEGMAGELARVEHLRLKPALLPLLSGTVRLKTLELDRPVVTLARDAQGRPNWRFGRAEMAVPPPAEAAPAHTHPTARPPEAPAAAEVDDSLPVESLTIRDGSLSHGTLSLSALDAEVALGGKSGPFQGAGTAKLGGTKVALQATIDRIAAGRASPATATLRLPDEDAVLEVSGLVSRLSGGETLRGRLSAKAAEPSRTLARLGWTPSLPPGALNVTSDVVLSAEEANLSPLELALGELRATGSLSAALGAVPQVDVKLSAAALDLDRWTKPQAATKPTEAGQSAPAPAPQESAAPAAPGDFALPRDLFVSAALAVDSLTWHGQQVRQAKLDAVLDGGEIMLRQAHAKLPGATDAALDGTVSADKGRPVFDGTLRARSEQAGALLAWLGAGFGEDLRRLEVTAPLHVSWPELKLADARLMVDDMAVRGSAAARLDQQPALAVTAAVPGMELSVKGRLAAGKRVEDGAFKLTSSNGLRPLRALGLKPPSALERLGALTAEGTASGTLDAVALDARAESGGVTLSTRGTLAGLDSAPRADLAVQARAASTGQVIRLFRDKAVSAGGPFALDARLVGDAKVFDVNGLTLRAGPTSLSGQGQADLRGAKPAISATLSADTLALDALLSPERSGGLMPERSGRLLPGGPLLPPTMAPQARPVVPAGMVGAGASPFSREPLELSGLDGFDAKLALTAQTITAKAWRLDNAVVQAFVQNGSATVERLTGKLLGGDLSATAKLTSGATPALAGQFTVAGADLAAIKLSGAGLALTRGRLDADARFTTAGRSSQDMAARLNGDGKLLVRDGVLDGFDLPAVNQQMGNLRNIGSVLGLVQAGLSGGRTPFTRLAGTVRADNGVVVSRDLKLEAEGGGADGDAQVNLPEWSTRTAIAFHLASAPQTPVGIRLEGPLENPRKVIDLNAIQQHMVTQGLGKALKQDQPQQQSQQGDQPREKNTGKNILKNLLKGLGGQ